MAGDPTLFEMLGLPSVDEDARVAEARMRERFGELLFQGRYPWPSELARDRERPPHEELSQCTGLLTHADIFGGSECLEEWAEKYGPEDESDEEDDGFPWKIGALLAAGWVVWEMLDKPVSLPPGEVEGSLDGFEIDGIPWTVERMHHPGAPHAARVGEMMLHGGTALPGPGSSNVKIGGLGALTFEHAVASCPLTNVVGIPHLPQPGSWTTTNTKVFVNGWPLLRRGDWVVETPGGANPISGGMPSVVAGPPARSSLVEEVHYLGLDLLSDGLERAGWTGPTLKLSATASWTWQGIVGTGVAVGLLHAGAANPMLAPVAGWGAKKILAAIDKPEISLGIDIDLGSLFAEYREDRKNPYPWGPRGRSKRTRWVFDLPHWFDERSAEVDPTKPVPPTKKEEKEGWKQEPLDDGPKKHDQDGWDFGPIHKRSQDHDSEEQPEAWED
ncbi:MAG: hypothetical protein ACRBN8_43235 [Nannocystales bacterium]